jgi:hypothetical protein
MRIAFASLVFVVSACGGLKAKPCSIEDTDTGALIKCPDGSQQEILDGTKGETGATGETGAAGDTGAAGAAFGIQSQWGWSDPGDLNGTNNIADCSSGGMNCHLGLVRVTKYTDGSGQLFAQLYYAGGYLSSCVFTLTSASGVQENICRIANAILLRYRVDLSTMPPTFYAAAGQTSGVVAADTAFTLSAQ